MTILKPYEQGAKARSNAIDFTANPFPSSLTPFQHREWARGWKEYRAA